jgi:cell division transport system permease protein
VSRFTFFIGEAIRAIRRNLAPTTAAVVTTVLTAILIGVLVPVFQATQSKSSDVRSQLELRVFLFDDATDEEVASLQGQIEGIRNVNEVSFLSKADALTEFKRDFGQENRDVLKELRGNPLPANFIVKPDDPANLDSIRAAMNTTGEEAGFISPIIKDVDDRQATANRIEEVTGALKLVLTVITALLIVASLLLVGNTIRLSIYTRRREIEVMRLVGATRWFIRWPFMIEGVMVGMLGGAVAIIILWAGKITIVDPLSESFALVQAQESMSFITLVACLFGAAVLVSAIGSGLTLRRFLKV